MDLVLIAHLFFPTRGGFKCYRAITCVLAEVEVL